jgi:hypothetical protein
MTTFRCHVSGTGNEAVYRHITMRLFYAKCPKVNMLCNKLSNAYVAAVTVCAQRLYV